MSSQDLRRITFGSPEWEPLVQTVAARTDIQRSLTDVFAERPASTQWILVTRVLQELGVELEPFERMKLQGTLVDIFFPKGIPRKPDPDTRA